MYKVFVNEKLLTFSEAPREGVKNTKFDNASTFDIAMDKLTNSSIPALNIFYHNLEKLWGQFTHHFEYLEAAGGIVESYDHSKILFIQRFQKWDLPKGKVEKGESLEETAIREIGEECGVNDVSLEHFLMTTYHIYKVKNNILKATHWYLLHCNEENPKLVPQKEEGIEKVEWIAKDEMDQVYINTYENIQLLLHYYLDQ